MLIGIDASRANRKYKSGTEWYSYYLIRELAKIDAKNQYILYTDKPLTNGLADLSLEQGKFENIKIKNGWQKIISPYNNFRCKIIKQILPFFWTQLSLSLEMLFHPPDVLFIPAHALPIIHPKKSAVTIHDIGFEREKRLYGSDKIGSENILQSKIFDFIAKLFTKGEFSSNILDYHTWSTKFALKHVQKIIAVSEFTKKEIIEVYHADSEKIKVVHNGFNNAIYKPVADYDKTNIVLNKYGIKCPYIFYVGRLEKKKNIPALVEAFAIMKEKHKEIKHKLVLVGSIGYGFDEVKYVIEEFDLNNDVIITGWVPEEDMLFIYYGATAFVFPSFYEGFGIPLLQAMACETAIAASRIPAILEIAEGSALLFNPLDKTEMAEVMAKIITDDNLRQDLIAKGRMRIKNFSQTKTAQETLAILENL